MNVILHARIQKDLSEGVQLCQRFFFGFESFQIPLSEGKPSAHQQNAIKMAFCRSANDGPTLIADFVAL